MTLAFIFSRSLKNNEESRAESDTVGEIVEEIIPDEVPQKDFIIINIRKVAHFLEFSVLGAEIAVYVLVFKKKPLFIAASYIFGLISAFLDETVQIFSMRGPSITDVWIDFLGFCLFASLVYVVYYAVSFIIKCVKHRRIGGGSCG